MVNISSKNQMLLVDTLLTGLLSSMALVTLAPLTPISLPAFWTIIFLSLLSAIIVFLLTRKPFLLPICCVLLLIGVLLLLLTGYLASLVSDFLTAILDNTSNALHPVLINGLFFVSALLFSLFFFAFNRKFYTFFVPLILCSLSAIRLYFSGSAYFYFSLTILLFILFISLAKSRGKAHAKILSEDIEASRAYHTFTSIVIVILVLISAIAISPKSDGQWQSARLVQTTRDISSLLRLEGRKQSMSGIFDIRFTGFQPLDHRLGGDIILDHTIVMNVYTSTPTLLIGSYRDTYDGQMWHNSLANTTFRYDSLLLRRERNRVFLDRIPMGEEEFETLYNRIVTEGSYRIFSTVFGRSIFYAGRVEDIYDTDFDRNLLAFNDHGELFIDASSRRGMSYKMDTAYIDRSRPRFDQNVIELERLSEDFHDPYYDRIAENYLQLPEFLPQDVYDLTLEITHPEMSPYQNARSIEIWLSENCIYTLTPGTPPEDEDFVSYFLQTREGYCVYFASAMTIMARCIGLPSRYVSGYSLTRSASDTNFTHFIAANSSAHAWTEIYFKGIGWIPFDATNLSTVSAFSINTELNETWHIPVTVTPSPTPTLIDTEIEENNDLFVDNDGINYKTVLLFLLSVVILLFITIILKVIYLMNDNTLYRKIHLNSRQTNKEKLEKLFSRSIKQLSIIGLPFLQGETINEYIDRTQSNNKLKTLKKDWEPVIKMKYANIMPSNNDIENLYALCIKLEKWMPKQCGRLNYIIFRIIKTQ